MLQPVGARKVDAFVDIAKDKDPRRKLVVIKFCGLIGFSLATVHGIASLCLITPACFAEDGRLDFEGELGLIFGIIALWALSLPAITTLPMMPKAIGGMRWNQGTHGQCSVPHSCQACYPFFVAIFSEGKDTLVI